MHFAYRVHALERMFQRNISDEEVQSAILHGEVIEAYPDDEPYPSYLSLYRTKENVLHVVYAVADQGQYIVITVYRPDPHRWSSDFRQRRKP